MIVSFEELKGYSGIPKWSSVAEDGAKLILAGLQGELEAYLRRPIETEEFTEDYVIQFGSSDNDATSFYNVYSPLGGYVPYSGVGPASVPVRNSPVASISSVGRFCPTSGSVAAIERSASGWTQQRYGVDVFGVIAGETLRITYTAGLEWDKPGALAFFKLLILRAATRETRNLYDQNVGKQNFDGEPELAAPVGFSLAELESAKRYRRQRI